MNTRSKARAESSEFDAMSEGEKTTYLTDEEVDRCDECDKECKINEGAYIKNTWYCKICLRNLEESVARRKDNVEDQSLQSSTVAQKTSIGYIWTALISVVVCGGAFVSYRPTVVDPSSWFGHTQSIDCGNSAILKEELRGIRQQFPSQPLDTWISFASGIRSVHDEKRPTTFLMYHKAGDKTADCLASKVSKFVSKCFNGTTNIIDVNSKDLKEEIGEDGGKFIEDYRKKVLNQRVMVVRNFNELPGHIAREFHYFSDSYQPIVDEAFYFIIMSTDDKIINKVGIAQKVEKTFKKTWSDSVKSNVLDPLIARMTENIIPVVSEPKSIC